MTPAQAITTTGNGARRAASSPATSTPAGRAHPANPCPAVSAEVAASATSSTVAASANSRSAGAGTVTRPRNSGPASLEGAAPSSRPAIAVPASYAGEGVVMHAERDPYEAAMLASCPPGTRRDIYRVGAAPGAGHRARPHTAGTVEHLILGTGRVPAGPEGEAVELGPGEYLRYPGDIPHVFGALEPDTLGVIIMEHV